MDDTSRLYHLLDRCTVRPVWCANSSSAGRIGSIWGDYIVRFRFTCITHIYVYEHPLYLS